MKLQFGPFPWCGHEQNRILKRYTYRVVLYQALLGPGIVRV